MSGRRGRLHELTPGRSIQSAPHCCRQAKIELAQIVLDRPQPLLRSTGSASPVFGNWEDPECRPGELENGLVTGVGR